MSIHPFDKKMLTFITTNDCTALCDHCLMCCSPGAKSYLTSEQMIKTIDEVNEKYGVNIVVFTGGEPMLLKAELLKTILHCYNKGIFTRVVTNAYWAETEEKADIYLKILRKVGLNEINISYDDFHAAYIPEENIRNVWKAAKGKGFHAVVVAVSESVDSKIDSAYIRNMLETNVDVWTFGENYGPEEIKAAQKEDGTAYVIIKNNIKRLGRAEETISEDRYFEPEEKTVMYESCSTVCKQPTVSYENHLLACCGANTQGNAILDLGDLNETSAEMIMKKAADSVLVNAIHELGPRLLMEFVKEVDPEITFKEKYYSLCEMCADLTENVRAVQVLRESVGEVYLLIKEMKKQRAQSK